MKKFTYLVAAGAALMMLGAGCSPAPRLPQANNAQNLPLAGNVNVVKTADINYLASSADMAKFCNGADMDSDGFRKTITVKKTAVATKSDLTPLELVQETLAAATGDRCVQVLNKANIKVANGIVTMAPVEGWAGVSISLCGCKPLIEVNALQIPGIAKVVWQ
jgi:hypothetical protein